MAKEIVMPKLGLTMTEGTIESWYKKEGEAVQECEKLFSVSTDKLTNDVEATASGVLLRVLVAAGGTVPCLTPVAVIGARGESVSPVPAAAGHPAEAEPGSSEGGGVLVIGGGPGGSASAMRCADRGKKVAIIEARARNGSGGTCVNRGCIPTKALMASANLYASIKEAKTYGINVDMSAVSVDFKAIDKRKNAVINGLVASSR